MKFKKLRLRFFRMRLLIMVFVSATSSLFVFSVKSLPASAYYYRFTVDREGSTEVEINFYSTVDSAESWVFVPKLQFTNWSLPIVTKGQIVHYDIVETDQVAGQGYYFYQVFKFRYQADGFFNMTIKFDFTNGALISDSEPRGIFYSPQIGFKSDSEGRAEVFFHQSFTVDQNKAIATGLEGRYNAAEVQNNPPRVLFRFQEENIVRLQVEFNIESYAPNTITLKSSDNKTFTFKTATRYQTYAQDVLKLYDRIYSNFTSLFNVTLNNVAVQWFLPDFEILLTVGGFVPFTGERLGEININVFFIRAVNGTVETIAAHELIHHFTKKTGISPSDFLWFHEGMAQYLSVTLVSDIGYEGATSEKNNLESGAAKLIQDLKGENFGKLSLQSWSPSYQPPNVKVESLYAAAYYVISRLPQIIQSQGFDYYRRFFKLVGQLPSDHNGLKIQNISELAYYLSKANNASVALTLQRWGFTVADIYNSPVDELTEEAGKSIRETNPVFQPHRFLAEYFYQQALLSAERGEWERAQSLLQLSVSLAKWAPLFTFLTIIAFLVLLVLILSRSRREPEPIASPLPPEILQPSA